MDQDSYPRREIARSHQGMVACPHFLASKTGAEILRQGGNAVDAAIAIQATLSVVYPHMTGLGGDAFWLIYAADGGQIYGLNGSGRSAQQATVDFYRDRGLTEIPHRGSRAVITVPGAVDSWAQAHQRLGQLPWADLLEPAIAIATKGYPVTGSQAYWSRRDQPYFLEHNPAPCPFFSQGALPKAGETLTNPDLAATLRTLAREGAAALYYGSLAERITGHLGAVGGLLGAEDFAHHRSDWVAPICTNYRGTPVYQLPPNSQGFTLLQMLNLIEPFDIAGIGHGTADYYHLLVEATKLAFADRDRWLTDPDFEQIPLETLISKGYADARRPLIAMDQAGSYLPGAIGGDTVYTAVVDAAGNAVSVIQSLYFDFGSAVVVPGTGFVLQNRGAFFSLDPSHINHLAPGKRTFHTLMPGMALHPDGTPALVFGTMGGEGQPQTQVALLTRVLDFGYDPQQAIALPRWLWGRTWGETTAGLTVEGRIPTEVRAELTQRGHTIISAPPWTEKMGHAHLIRRCPETGECQGSSDPRSDGTAIGLD